MGGHSVPRTLQTANGHGSEVVGKQVEALKKANVPITLHAEITELHRDRDGRVLGVAVRKEFNFGEPGSGLLKNVRARKGVVLACGGFSEDLHFRTVQDPRLTADYKTTNQPGATAEGLIAALRLGAASVQLDQIQLLPLTSPDDEGIGSGCGFIAGCGMAHGLLVDPASGKRFVSELDDRKNQSDAIIACGHPAISIADSHGAKFAWWGLDHRSRAGP